MAPYPKYRAAASFPAMDEPARGFRFGALAHRNFRLFFLGQGVSLIGTWMQNVAQGWLVLELTNSPFYVGLVSALGSLGVLLLTLYAGVVVDRTNKHRLVILTQTLSMLPAFALAALVWTRAVAVWHVAALAAFLGLVNAFDIPARQAFIVELVEKDDLVSAIALNSSAFNAARVIGPAVAGAVIGVLGVGVCFFLNGVDRKSTRLNSSHGYISYAVFCLKKKTSAHAPAAVSSINGMLPLFGTRTLPPFEIASCFPRSPSTRLSTPTAPPRRVHETMSRRA